MIISCHSPRLLEPTGEPLAVGQSGLRPGSRDPRPEAGEDPEAVNINRRVSAAWLSVGVVHKEPELFVKLKISLFLLTTPNCRSV